MCLGVGWRVRMGYQPFPISSLESIEQFSTNMAEIKDLTIAPF